MAYEKGKPEPGIKAKFLDDRVRGNNDFIQPAINQDHDFTDANAAEQSGKHKTLHMLEQSSPGASASDEGNLAVVDSGTQPELEFTSEDGNAKLLTDEGKINNIFADMGNVAIDEDDMVSDSDTHFPTQQSVKAYQDNNTTDDTETDLSSKSWFLDEDDMSSDDATKVSSQQSIKAFVDSSSADGYVPTLETGGTSSIGVTVLPNGLRIAYGSESVASAAEDTITPIGFTNIYSVTATLREDGNTNRSAAKIGNINNTTFTIRNTNSQTHIYNWICIGR
jgi:hypothetical protein